MNYNELDLIQKTTNQLSVGDVIRLGGFGGAWFVRITGIDKSTKFNMVKMHTVQLDGDHAGLQVTYPYSKTTRQWVAVVA